MKEENKVKLFEDYNIDEIIEVLFIDFFNKEHNYSASFDAHQIIFGNNLEKALHKLCVYGVVERNEFNYKLTKDGFKVLELGSWATYLQYLKHLETQAEADRQLTRKVGESSIMANKNSKIFACVSGAFIGIGLLFQILAYIQQKEALNIQREQADIENKSLHKTLHDSVCPLLHYHNLKAKTEEVKKSKIDTVSQKP